MSCICPKDLIACPDDLCRGSGLCMRTGQEMFDLCPICRRVYSREYDIECACEPDDDYSEDEPADAQSGDER